MAMCSCSTTVFLKEMPTALKEVINPMGKYVAAMIYIYTCFGKYILSMSYRYWQLCSNKKKKIILIFVEWIVPHFAWRHTFSSDIFNQCFMCHRGGNYIIFSVAPHPKEPRNTMYISISTFY